MAVGDKKPLVMAIEFAKHIGNKIAHVTQIERDKWNGKADGTHSHDERYYTETEIDTSLSNKADVPIDIPLDSDLDNYISSGLFFNGGAATTILNKPMDVASFSLLVEKNGAYLTGVKQTFTPYTSTATYCRVYVDGVWRQWVLFATATPPMEYDLPLSEGVSNYGVAKSRYYQNQFSEATVLIDVATSTTTGSEFVIATLPVGFRPTIGTDIPAIGLYGTTFTPLRLYINGTGDIILSGDMESRQYREICAVAHFVVAP